jgi:hypothetical protein
MGPYGRAHGVAYVGHHGTLVVDRGGWEIIPETNKAEKKPYFEAKKQKEYGDGMDEHVKNFLECIRSGGTLHTPVEVGAKTAIVSEMGNIAYRTGKRIHWDDTTKTFAEEEATALMKLNYSENWNLPVV